jgi:diadenosine tetraphosphate (Ap4A) HIT family hydrolase
MIPETTATMEAFGYPATLVADCRWWSVLARPKQPTLGSLVLAAKAGVPAFSDLPREAFAELADATSAVERALKAFCAYERINYLMLMMVDPHPHFHVIPRYPGARSFEGAEFPDVGWPGPPALDRSVRLSDAQREALVAALKTCFTPA